MPRPKLPQDPTLPQGFNCDFRERFWRRVVKTDTGCWIWNGAIRQRGGQGVINRGGRGTGMVGAHEASWIMHYGVVPIGKIVLHNCPGYDHGNPACVRPDHLWLGTHTRMRQVSTDFLIAHGLNPLFVTKDFLKELRFTEDLPVRFLRNIKKTEGCWLWTGCVDDAGYGRIAVGNGRDRGAHVISWILHNGIIRDGKDVCHNCPGGDNPGCVNPKHLWLGTQQDNTVDAARKERFSHTKVPFSSVLDIRNQWPRKSMKQIAKEHGLHPSYVSRIIRGERRIHIPYSAC